MSLFNWFSAKSRTTHAPHADDSRRAAGGSSRAAPSPVQEADSPDDTGRRPQRHARREQLYIAIREAMTRAGVLSASYKFKVLSLDTRGNEFLVMMDLARDSGVPAEQLGEVEVLIIHNARVRFEITVAGVYWRADEAATVGQPLVPATASQLVPPPEPAARPPAKVAPSSAAVRYDPIQAEELAAFRQALNAASTDRAASPSSRVPRADKGRGREPSYALLTGFEDTELAPSAPVLSATQYGDLA